MAMTSAQRKLARGIEQVKTLCAEATAFEHRDAYVLEPEEESRTDKQIRYRCLVFEREAPPDAWPLLAGEAIQNLRAALDHSVYAVSKQRSTKTQFPIFTDECEFKVIGARMIQGVPAPIRALIEKAQPYRLIPDGPQFDSLEVLRSLSNIDKHRELNTVAAAVAVEYVGAPEGIEVRWEKYATNRVLNHGQTHVSTLVVTAKDKEAKLDGVKVNPGFRYQVRIEGKPLDWLPPICRRVYRHVAEVETGDDPPFVSYPL